MRNRSRNPLLFFIKEDDIVLFEGKSIERVCRVLSGRYTRNGKWSGTDFEIEVGSWIPVILCTPFEGWGESWSDIILQGFEIISESDHEIKSETLISRSLVLKMLSLIDPESYKRLRDAVSKADYNESIKLE